jgi:hypothetical protein
MFKASPGKGSRDILLPPKKKKGGEKKRVAQMVKALVSIPKPAHTKRSAVLLRADVKDVREMLNEKHFVVPSV